MALTLLQEPTGPAYSYNELVWVVGSDLVGPAILPENLPVEHSFVIDIFEGSTRVGQYRKQANPNGNCVIELSSVLNNELEYDLGILGASGDTVSGDSSASFSVRFGEEFQNSDGVLQIHSGLTGDPLGEAALTGDEVLIIKGFREYNEGDFTGVQINPGLLSSIIGTRVHRDDTLSISELQANPSVIAHHRIDIPATGDTVTDVIGGVSYTFDIYDEKSFLGESRFAWFNRTGGVDYFTFDQEGSVNTTVENTDRARTIVDYSGSSSSNRETANPRAFKASTSTYAQTFEERYTKNSRWLNEEDSEAVSGIFDSPSVYLYQGTEWVPVSILNGAYPSRATTRETINFQYQLEYRLRNDKRGF